MVFIEEFNLYANSRIAKISAVFLVIFLIGYHGFLHLIDGGDSCQRLLSDGRFQGTLVWQPYGCMIHTYSHVDAIRCLRYVAFLKEPNNIGFVGDSRIRQLFHNFHHKIYGKKELKEKQHSDIYFNDTSLMLNLKFYWRPNLDNNMISLCEKWLKNPELIPKLLILGSATHSIKNNNASLEGLNEFQKNFTILAQVLNKLSNKTRVLWMLQDPVVEAKLGEDRKMITNEQIELYNKVSIDILRYTNVLIWYSSRIIAKGTMTSFDDGLHEGSLTLNYDSEILLNFYCNHHLYFNDGMCCNSREGFTYTQITLFSLLCICSLLTIMLALRRWLFNSSKSQDGTISPTTSDSSSSCFENGYIEGLQNTLPTTETYNSNKDYLHRLKEHSHTGPNPQEVLMAIGKLGLIIGYFFLCDRSSLFMKENKYFSDLNFWLPIAYVLGLGLFFTEESPFARVLNKDMTNEWRGWMQLIILVYHMTGAGQNLSLYLHYRILISAHLFLMGYGQFSYYWNGGDMGLIRYLQVMFRYNFLTTALCLLMNRNYQFYYYIPMVSFWYTVFHITMVFPPSLMRPTHINGEHSSFSYFYCIAKFLILGGAVTIFYLSEVFFEKVFLMRFWKFLFVSVDDDIHGWWNNWKLDRYSMLYGMFSGLIYQALCQYNLIDDKNGANILHCRLSFVVSIFGLIFAGSYTILRPLCAIQENCEEIHPYMIWVPIIGYIVLRNIFGILRSRYSSFFSWFGSIHVEMFVCQYHIWLAADTQGVLFLVPSYPVANVLISSFIFLCVCHELHKITNILVRFLVPFDKYRAVRNFTIIFLALFCAHFVMENFDGFL